MENLKKLSVLLFILISYSNSYSQASITFQGFDQAQCGTITNHGYSYQNISCASHSYGFRLNHITRGQLVYSCGFGSARIHKMIVLDSLTVIFVKSDFFNYTVVKTSDGGVTWRNIGAGFYSFNDLIMLNKDEGYLVSTFNPGSGNIPYIRINKASDNSTRKTYTNNQIDSNFTVIDTILSQLFCPYDSISFSFNVNGATTNYLIVINPLSTGIANNEHGKKASIFPNPFTDFIEISEEIDISTIRIFNINGKEVKRLNFNGLKLNTEYFQPGVFIIKGLNKNKPFKKKIIKI